MTQLKWHLQTEATVRRQSVVYRRDVLKLIPAATCLAALGSWTNLVTAQSEALRRKGMSCILLWMQGGPSQFETFAPKPDHPNGGETRAIPTSVSGIQIAEHLPHTAQVMDDICIVRSITSREGSHPRATFLLHTGYLPTASIKYPAFGSIAASQIGLPDCELPSFVRIGNRVANAAGAGFLGVEYDPFVLRDARRPPENTQITTSEGRFDRRLNLLGQIDGHFAQRGAEAETENQRKLYRRAARMIRSPQMAAFDLEREPRSIRDAYGESDFAAGCLLARRLVEAGVTFIEVSLGGWDTHQDNFARSTELCQKMDQPYAQLLRDLKERGLLETTLVIWMGEFGRTPRINPRAGRDHYPRAFCVALAGGHVVGGQVIGETDAGGIDVTNRPVTVPDLFRTFCHSLGIDPDYENISRIGRPIRIADDGAVVHELFG